MSDNSEWKDLKIGVTVVGVAAMYYDECRVEALGYDWVVLRHNSGYIVPCLLEPEDHFIIGTTKYNEIDGSVHIVNMKGERIE